jgi:predicted porin
LTRFSFAESVNFFQAKTMGRIGSINNGQSSWATAGMISAFGTSDWGGYSAQIGNVMHMAGQWDNMIAYQTPEFAGFKVYAQYGMGTNDNENESRSDRYYALGATYNNGPFAGYFAVDSINYQTTDLAAGVDADDIDDSLTVTLGGSYDFDVAKLYLGAQYFDEVKLSKFSGVLGDTGVVSSTNDYKVKGFAVTVSTDVPLGGGVAKFGIGYTDADTADSQDDVADVELQRYVVSVGYDYPFSKRTDVYAIASYMQDSWENNATKVDADPSAYTLYVGLRHRF